MDTQNSVTTDWHPADVKAALEKRGISLAKLARQNGYSHIQRVLISPWLGAEQVVARALGLPPEQIWPSRYQTSRDRAHLQTRNAAAAKLARRTLARTEG
ncbi:helix-turn-helix domain-containing protein [Burkholderiaceae bacterium UC74_6]